MLFRSQEWDRWLDPAYSDVDMLSAGLGPCDPKTLVFWPVSRLVNAPKNQGPKLIEEDRSG